MAARSMIWPCAAQLIMLGEDMVNLASMHPVDADRPKQQIDDAESRLYDLAERGKYGQGFMSFERGADACHRHGECGL